MADRPNVWHCFTVGIATGDGAGQPLAQWMVDGAAPFHQGKADPARFHAAETPLAGLMTHTREVLGRQDGRIVISNGQTGDRHSYSFDSGGRVLGG